MVHIPLRRLATLIPTILQLFLSLSLSMLPYHCVTDHHAVQNAKLQLLLSDISPALSVHEVPCGPGKEQNH